MMIRLAAAWTTLWCLLWTPAATAQRTRWRNPPAQAEAVVLTDEAPFVTFEGTITSTVEECTDATPASVRYWFLYSGDGRTVQVDTVGSGFDTTLAVFVLNADGTRRPLLNNDNADDTTSTSFLEWETETGMDYLILISETSCSVASAPVDPAPVVITFRDAAATVPETPAPETPAPVPSGDGTSCSSPIPLTAGESVGGTYTVTDVCTVETLPESDDFCFTDVSSAGYQQWFVYVGEDQEVTVSTAGGTFDTRLSLILDFNQQDPEATECDLGCVYSNDDYEGSVSAQMSFMGQAGIQYLIFVEDYPCTLGNSVPVGESASYAVTLEYGGDGQGYGMDTGSGGGGAVYTAPGCEEPIPITMNQDIGASTSLSEEVTCEPLPSVPEYCFGSLGTIAFRQWYIYEGNPDATELITISTADSQFDTRISIYAGNNCEDLTCTAGNDDANENLAGAVTFVAEQGVPYLIYVEDYPCWIVENIPVGVEFSFNMSIFVAPEDATSSPVPAPGEGDTGGGGNGPYAIPGCDDATTMRIGDTEEFTLSLSEGATCEVYSALDVYCFPDLGSLAWRAWYVYVGQGRRVFATTGTTARSEGSQSNFDTRIAVYTGSCGELQCFASNDDDAEGNVQAGVSWVAEEGVTYYIYVEDYPCSLAANFAPGEDIEYRFEIEVGDGTLEATPPEGCEDHIPLSIGDAVVTTVDHIGNASACESIPTVTTFCFSSRGSTGYYQWYSVVGDGNKLTISTKGSDFDTRVEVLDGTCDAPNCISRNDDDLDVEDVVYSEVTFETTAGTTYYVHVESARCRLNETTATPTADISINVTVAAEDAKVDPDRLWSYRGCNRATEVFVGSEVSQDFELDESHPPCELFYAASEYCVDFLAGPGLARWYVYNGDGTEILISTAGSDVPMDVQIFPGPCDENDCAVESGGAPETVFMASRGVQYNILVTDVVCTLADFRNPETNTLKYAISFSPTGRYEPPPIPTGFEEGAKAAGCEDAVALTVPAEVPITVIVPDDAPACSGQVAVPSYCLEELGSSNVSYWFTMEGSGREVTASTIGSSFDTRLSVYVGSCAGVACVGGNDDASVGIVQAEVTFFAEAETTYLIHVDDYPCTLRAGSSSDLLVTLKYAGETETPSVALSATPSTSPTVTESAAPTEAPVPSPTASPTAAPVEATTEAPADTRNTPTVTAATSAATSWTSTGGVMMMMMTAAMLLLALP